MKIDGSEKNSWFLGEKKLDQRMRMKWSTKVGSEKKSGSENKIKSWIGGENLEQRRKVG